MIFWTYLNLHFLPEGPPSVPKDTPSRQTFAVVGQISFVLSTNVHCDHGMGTHFEMHDISWKKIIRLQKVSIFWKKKKIAIRQKKKSQKLKISFRANKKFAKIDAKLKNYANKANAKKKENRYQK